MTEIFPHHPKCECDHCDAATINAVMERFLEQSEARKEQEKAAEIERLGRQLSRAG